jgi:glycosyltransferase involved in cell wall biosynthesis
LLVQNLMSNSSVGQSAAFNPSDGNPLVHAPTGAVRTEVQIQATLKQAGELGQQALGDRETDAKAEVNASECHGRKLIIQIPCFNEAASLPVAIAELPREVEGFASVEWLVIDDGSTDETVDIARRLGVDHIVQFPANRGLAQAFMAGLDECVRLGADVIVNTDADNQYCADDIPLLTTPIVDGAADMMIGARPIGDTAHFSSSKKLLQKLGSWVVRQVSNADVDDAPSGFRAFSRDTAMQLNVFNGYTYTLETIIQAGHKNLAVRSVPIRTFMTYRPLHFFAVPGVVMCVASLLLCARYMVFWFMGGGEGHVQSLILAAILMSGGLIGVLAGLLGDLISVNRKLMEKANRRLGILEQQLKSSVAGQDGESR